MGKSKKKFRSCAMKVKCDLFSAFQSSPHAKCDNTRAPYARCP